MTTLSSRTAFQHRAAASGLTAPLVREVVARFYDKVRADPVLGPIFEQAVGADWGPHIEKICSFWLTATRLGSGYKGADFMPAHMNIPGMSAQLAPRWLSLFQTAAREGCAPEAADALIDIAERMIETIELALAPKDTGARR